MPARDTTRGIHLVDIPGSGVSEIRAHPEGTIGHLGLTAPTTAGSAGGRIDTLRITRPDPGLHWARAAITAAGERLVARGCGYAQVTLPTADHPLLPAFRALGYRELARTLSTPLGGRQPVDGAYTLHALTERGFLAWLPLFRADYRDALRRGGIPAAEAEAGAGRWAADLTANRLDSHRHVLRSLSHRGVPVGHLWAAVTRGPQTRAFVLDVRIAPAHRGRGHGRALLRAAENEALSLGCSTLSLSVFADNRPALRLYDALGYPVSGVVLLRRLTG
ncbi:MULTISPECIES: GNAT family N-acetyltransferase [unclassified Streptomyces]|uniref:GNAT family N-acetyltransferase n=1 Tax=unclassified Streptomyces TaxID=2593676 RepID=UPI001908B21E|nr:MULTISPECIES: GNAT family N-acetyltransferase [unclassified Streptomyces]MCU4746906.1 GNAT family N-acetyltransferase [Streptomyces sp. G-5]QQN77602.1 GNAT family N-acetyltransferase [Streptomyces sp. XC 2026]